jgi:hypothetical protein
MDLLYGVFPISLLSFLSMKLEVTYKYLAVS